MFCLLKINDYYECPVYLVATKKTIESIIMEYNKTNEGNFRRNEVDENFEMCMCEFVLNVENLLSSI